MTIGDLIEQLQELAETHGDDTEVRLAIQPRWAFEHSIGSVVCNVDAESDEDDDEDEEEAGREPVVYIGEGTQLGYLPGDAQRALGWGR